VLAQVIETNAVRLPLEDRKFGIRVHIITDRSLLTTATFVLAVKASMQARLSGGTSRNRSRSGRSSRSASSSTWRCRRHGASACPWRRARFPTVPAPPIRARQVEFYWKQLLNSQAFAIHLASEFPQAEMEFWAIRG
jgi:type VI secretion system protein ImpJ